MPPQRKRMMEQLQLCNLSLVTADTYRYFKSVPRQAGSGASPRGPAASASREEGGRKYRDGTKNEAIDISWNHKTSGGQFGTRHGR